MKDKIIGFFVILTLVLILIISFMHYQKKALKAEKTALYEDVLRYKQSLIEQEKQNEALLQAEKDNEQFKQDLSNDNSSNLDVVIDGYILKRMHAD